MESPLNEIGDLNLADDVISEMSGNEGDELKSDENAFAKIATALESLCGVDWEIYLRIFKAERVSDDDLKHLSDADLRELIPRMGPRNKFKVWMKRNEGGLCSMREHVMTDPKYQKIANFIQSANCKKIVILTGAGISVSAGIPDFRSKDGYFNTVDLDDEDLHLTQQQKQHITANKQYISCIDLFRENPYPLLNLMASFYSTEYAPTVAHYFVRLLCDHNLVKKVFTQNIDGLHAKSGVRRELILPVHGTVSSAICIACGNELDEYEYELFKVKTRFKRDIPVFCGSEHCVAVDSGGFVKPNVVLFGEKLPTEYFKAAKQLDDVDLLIIMGTSLKVAPVNQIPSLVPYKDKCARLVINREPLLSSKGCHDVELLGNADDVCLQLIHALGWKNDLKRLQNNSGL